MKLPSIRRRALPAVVEQKPWYVTLEAEQREPSLKPLVIAGVATITIAFGTFFGWAFGASLDSAAVSQGSVIVDSRRKTVSHFEGGILKEMLVKEGEHVKAGQVLLRLDATFAQSSLDQLRVQRLGALARLARLSAEQSDRRTIEFPEELLRSQEPGVQAVLETERKLFQSRWADLDGKIAIQRKKIEQYQEELEALAAQTEANDRQLTLVTEELEGVRQLYEKGYERRPRLLELEGRASELRGRRGELNARKSQTEQSIAAAELEILAIESERRTEIGNAIQETQLSLSDINEKMRAAENVLSRVEVTSPQDGYVTNIRFFTPGGAIGAGEPILDIVPFDDPMVIEARIEPRAIDSVRVGLPVQVRLTAYNMKTLPTLEGRVTYVSADSIVDERTGQPYFVGRVALLPDELESLENVSLYPGMPADVVIVTGERRAIDYLISPITDSMNRAFRED